MSAGTVYVIGRSPGVVRTLEAAGKQAVTKGKEWGELRALLRAWGLRFK